METASQEKDTNGAGSHDEDDPTANALNLSQHSAASSPASTPVERALRMSIIRKVKSKASHALMVVTSGSHDRETDDNNNNEGEQEITRSPQGSNLQPIDEDQVEVRYDSEEEDSIQDGHGIGHHLHVPGKKQAKKKAKALMKNLQKRSAFKLLKNAHFGLSRRHLPSEMDLIKQQLEDTYLSSGDTVILHGYLHIQIIRAKGLRNMDFMRGCQKIMCCKCGNNVSDPYVTVHAGIHRLLKTPHVLNDLNPEYNLDYFVPVCHPIKYLEFRVKDNDSFSSETLGKCKLPVHELIRFNTDGDYDESESSAPDLSESGRIDASSRVYGVSEQFKQKRKLRMLRTGIHKTEHLDHRPQHGSLEYFVEFIPKDLLHAPPKDMGLLTKKSAYSMVVPGVYFPVRRGNSVRYYVDADDRGAENGTPVVRYGANDLESTWKPRRFFRDIYDSICNATQMVYIVGWSVDHTQSLLRGKELIDGLNECDDGGNYSPIIGELLNQKANEGVVVNMLVWDDMTSNALKTEGVVATRDEQLRHYFRGSKVNLRLVPMGGGDSNMLKKFRLSVYYTHHQKCVIVDTPKRELLAYVGGIDLTYGRYENGTYSLFRSLQTDHKNDFHNACVTVSPLVGPREPWHDIHSRVQGPGALDLLKNFEERWVGQGGDAADLLNIEEKGIRSKSVSVGKSNNDDDDCDGNEAWSTQLFRSIDEKTAKLTDRTFETTNFDDIEGVEFGEKKKIRGGKRMTLLQKVLKTPRQNEQHFVASDADNIEVSRPLDSKREIKVDSSVHKGMVHHIRNAQHSIYIESQYFLSSSFLWKEKKTSKCCNLIAAEIACKICEKIEAGERFVAYIVVPMWPEGLPDSASVQDILWYQSLTMKSMYKRIQESIDRVRRKLEAADDGGEKPFEDVTATDYLNFYCLANRETKEGGQDNVTVNTRLNGSVTSSTAVGPLNVTRRHLVYTHSKMTIVDDAVLLCGSANINQRSLDGNRDSELLMGSWQENYLATKDDVAHGDVHGFRLHCWAHLTGKMEEVFRKPSSLECVRRVNSIANTNWNMYVQKEPCEMKSYLVPFPVKVLSDGDLVPMTENGKFPDTNSNIMGTKGTLPKFLTT